MASPLKYMRLNVLWFYGQGLYKIDENLSRPIKALYSLWRLTCMFFMVSAAVLALNDILTKEGFDFDSIAVNSMLLVVYAGASVRLSYFYVFEDECAKIIERMNAKFRYETKTGLAEKNMENHLAFGEKAVTVWNLMGVFCTEAIMLVMLYFAGSTERRLPLPFWYPYDWKKSPYFEISYVGQIIAQALCGLTFTNTDMFFICLAHLTTGQLELLGWEFENLIYSALLKTGVPKEKVLELRGKFQRSGGFRCFAPAVFRGEPKWAEDILSSGSFRAALAENFKELIRFHEDFLSFWKGVNKFLNPLMLVNVLGSVFQMIMFAYILNTGTDVFLLFTTALYLIMVTTQIFITSYFGQLLITKNDDLRRALYHSPWYLCGADFQNTFRMVLRRIGWPIAATLGKFTTIDLGIFVWALRTSASYFTVLRQVTKEE